MFKFTQISTEEYAALQKTKSIGGSSLPDYSWALRLIEKDSEEVALRSESLVFGELLHKVTLEDHDLSQYNKATTKNFSALKFANNKELPDSMIKDLNMYKTMIKNCELRASIDNALIKEVGFVCDTAIPIRCKFDFVTKEDGSIVVHDIKTTSKRPPENEKELSFMFDDYSYDHQIMLYGWCARHIFDTKDVKVRFHFIHKNGIMSSLTTVNCDNIIFYSDNDIIEMVEVAEENYNYVVNANYSFCGTRKYSWNKGMELEVGDYE